MHDRPQSIPPDLPAVTISERRAQRVLLETAGDLAWIRNRLLALHVRLGERPEDDDMGEGRIPDSPRFSIRGAIECVVEDQLAPAIEALETAARETPRDLHRQWRERLAQRGGAL